MSGLGVLVEEIRGVLQAESRRNSGKKMKVKIAYTLELSDEDREAIRAHMDEEGKATRDEIKRAFIEAGYQEIMRQIDDGSAALGR